MQEKEANLIFLTGLNSTAAVAPATSEQRVSRQVSLPDFIRAATRNRSRSSSTAQKDGQGGSLTRRKRTESERESRMVGQVFCLFLMRQSRSQNEREEEGACLSLPLTLSPHTRHLFPSHPSLFLSANDGLLGIEAKAQAQAQARTTFDLISHRGVAWSIRRFASSVAPGVGCRLIHFSFLA